MYRCPRCGGSMQFSPEKQKIICEFCDSEFDPSELEEEKEVKAEEQKTYEEKPDENYYEATLFTCPQCGGQLLSNDDTAATFCSFCGASVLLEQRVSKELKPDVVIPFKVGKEEVAASYKKMIAKGLFVPTAMKKSEEIAKFRSIYMPYWIYDYEFHGDVTTKGETSRRRGDYIYTDHYNVTTRADVNYKGISFDASGSFNDTLSSAVAPYMVAEAKEFSPAYLTGHYADTKDVNSNVYEADAESIVKSHTATQVYGDEHRKYGVDKSEISDKVSPKLSNVRLGFFPVWFLSTRNRKGDRVSYAVVNGQTGKAAADLPISVAKYLIGSLILAAVIFVLMDLVADILIDPRMLLGFSAVLGIICLIIVNGNMNKVFRRDRFLDDKGYQAANKGKVKKQDIEKVSAVKEKKVSVSGKKFFKNTGVILGIAIVVICSQIDKAFDIIPVLVPIVIAVAIVGGIISSISKKAPVYGTAGKMPFKDKAFNLSKPLFGIVLSVLLMLVNPAEDFIMYGAAIISMLLILWSLIDIINVNNKLTTRKLPQLGKRGGDENA